MQRLPIKVYLSFLIQNKIDTIITADDKHFKNVKEIKVFNPFKYQKNKETENVPGGLEHKNKIDEIPEPKKKEKDE